MKSNKKRKYIATMQRRIDYLEKKEYVSDIKLRWDQAEIAALSWAIRTIKNLLGEDMKSWPEEYEQE